MYNLMLDGQEQIDLNFIENMEQKEYVEKDDFLPMDGAPNSHVVLRPGGFPDLLPGGRTPHSRGRKTNLRKSRRPYSRCGLTIKSI